MSILSKGFLTRPISMAWSIHFTSFMRSLETREVQLKRGLGKQEGLTAVGIIWSLMHSSRVSGNLGSEKQECMALLRPS